MSSTFFVCNVNQTINGKKNRTIGLPSCRRNKHDRFKWTKDKENIW